MGKNINEETNLKPTLSKPVDNQSKKYEKNFDATMKKTAPNVKLNEFNELLTEKEQSLKKKIWNLGKMETLAHSDPKLSVIYNDMAENGEEKYGYHYNETILNIIFNDYVLNSPKYLQLYKMAIPKKKKRRDKSGINQLKKAGEEIMHKKEELSKETDIEETTSAGSAGGAAGYVGYAGPAAWGSGDLDTKGKAKISKAMSKPIWKGGSIIGENNYLIDPSDFAKYVERLDESSGANSSGSYNLRLGRDKNIKNVSKEIDGAKDLKDSNKIPVVEPGKEIKEFGKTTQRKKDVADAVDIIKRNKDQKIPLYKGGVIIKETTEITEEQPHYELPKQGINPLDIPQDRNRKIEDIKQYFEKIGKRGAGDILNRMGNSFIDTMFNNIQTLKKGGLNEEAKSKAQQRFMGMVHALQKGEIKSNEVSDKIKKVAKTMKPKDVKDFASTKYKDKKGKELPEKIKENDMDTKNKIKETDQSMLDDNPTSMANKPQMTGSMGNGNVPTGVQDNGGLQEEMSLLEELDKELEAYSIHQERLKKIAEDKKPSAIVLKDRLGSQNQSNFKKDLQDSSVKDVIDTEKEMMWKDQQTDIGGDPQKLGQDIEKQTLKTSADALKNVGNSTNDKGDEVPKRNMTDDEQNKVDMMRKGQHSLVYDNKPDERFEERMKNDMGEEMFKRRKDQLEYMAKAPQYNKEPQPVEDTDIGKTQFNKEKEGWNDNDGLKESFITGRYRDALNKSRLIEFTLNEVHLITGHEKAEKQVNIEENLDLTELSFDGLGNKYDGRTENNKVTINETVNNALTNYKFYTDGVIIFAAKNSAQNLNENKNKKEKPLVSEDMKKIQHLLGYEPQSFINTKNVKNNRGF